MPAVILGYAEGSGFYLMDPSGTPLSCDWFATFEDAAEYCAEQGFHMFELEDDE